MGRRHISLGGLIWIVIGVIAAANRHFFDHLNGAGHIGSAVLAVLVWPLVLLKIHIGI